MDLILGEFKTYCTPFITCSVCAELLEDPVMLKECEHLFCRICINRWIAAQQSGLTCPDCRTAFVPMDDIKPPCRVVRNLITEIKLKCPFRPCKEVVRYADLDAHKLDCAHNPDGLIPCTFCNAMIKRGEVDSHVKCCVNYLTNKISHMELKMEETLRQIEGDQRIQLSKLTLEIEQYKKTIKTDSFKLANKDMQISKSKNELEGLKRDISTLQSTYAKYVSDIPQEVKTTQEGLRFTMAWPTKNNYTETGSGSDIGAKSFEWFREVTGLIPYNGTLLSRVATLEIIIY